MSKRKITTGAGFLVLPAESGPIDIIGDIHGCFDELLLLLRDLGYTISLDQEAQQYQVTPPENHKTVFVGDLVDRGPNAPEVLSLVMDMVEQGVAYCVTGNHDDKLYRKLQGKNVHIRYGLEQTLEQLEPYSSTFKYRVKKFLGTLPHHIILDNGRLVIAHAGLTEELHGGNSKSVRALCLYGPTNGKTDQFGYPIRLDWAADYCGHAIVVYGHTPVKEPRWRNNTINIDTGCVFGGKLSALTYPDHKLTTVGALHTYAEYLKPFLDFPE